MAALALIVCIAGAASFAAAGGPYVSVLLPASVVFGMGLYVNGVRRYDVMADRIRISGVLGDRDLKFEKILGFKEDMPQSFGSRFQSFFIGADRAAAVEVDADASFFSPPTRLWVRDRDAFLRAARTSLAAWQDTLRRAN